jgi:hypothetical protein
MRERPTADGKHSTCWLDALADAMRGIPLDAHHRNRPTRK